MSDNKVINQLSDIGGSYMNAPLWGFAKGVAAAAAIPLVAGTVQYFFARKNIKKEIDDLKNSYQKTLSISDKMSANKDRSAVVFQELCAVAPSIAMNPNMAAKVIEPRLKSGLTIDDVHKLTMINAHSKKSVLDKTPFGEAVGAAGLVTDRVFTTLGSRALDKWDAASNEVTRRAKHFKVVKDTAMKLDTSQGGAFINDLKNLGVEGMSGGIQGFNKQSSQNISESCIGEMMAERYVMWKNSPLSKEAGVISGAGDVISKAAPYILGSLAIAGVAHGVGATIDHVQRRHMEAQADEAFLKVLKNSDIIKGNKEMAHEAFDAIKTFAPNLAAKPAILKTFIEHSISVGGNMPPEMINQLATAQGSVLRSKAPGFASGFIDATSSIGKNLKDVNKEDKQGKPTTISLLGKK
jgi:hypothetical protein